jgi:hypothetical protein
MWNSNKLVLLSIGAQMKKLQDLKIENISNNPNEWRLIFCFDDYNTEVICFYRGATVQYIIQALLTLVKNILENHLER